MAYDPEDPHMSRDGRRFAHPMQARARDRWLEQEDKAPGGPAHEEAARLHGPASRVVIETEGAGRHRVTSTHPDGFTHTSVHPERFRAFETGSSLAGVEAPPAVATHGRARAHPTGPKEDERQRHEDGREEGL